MDSTATPPGTQKDDGSRGPRLREIPLRMMVPNLITVLFKPVSWRDIASLVREHVPLRT